MVHKSEKWITDIDGVYSSALHAGFKAKALDLAYIYVPNAVASAGVFTKNQCASETICHTQKIMKRNTLKALIVNAGNANTGTGKSGKQAVKETVRLTAEKLGLKQAEVGVASTGIIGVPLPLDIMKAGLNRLLQQPLKKEGQLIADAILTTDTCTKTVFLEQKIGKKNIQVAGICKGSGMIAPNMATMLAYLVTNVHMNNQQLQSYLKIAVDTSFNCITVDSDTSTSDMVVAFATGERQIRMQDSAQCVAFQSLLSQACQSLATQIVKDGEGVTKLIELTVSGAVTQKDAKCVAMTVLNSPLVKTAIHGADPNWGRLMMAIGKTPDIKLNRNKIGIAIGSYWLVKNGEPTSFDLKMVQQALMGDEVKLAIDLGLGNAKVRAWGCDLSKRYIDINVDYN